MSLHARHSGAWRRIYNPSMRHGGVWQVQQSMWNMHSSAWRNSRPDVDSTFTADTSTSGTTRYTGFALSAEPWAPTFGTEPSANYRYFGDYRIYGIYHEETYDDKLGWLPVGTYVTLNSSAAGSVLERLTMNGSTGTVVSSSLSGTYRRYFFSTLGTLSGTESYRLGGD